MSGRSRTTAAGKRGGTAASVVLVNDTTTKDARMVYPKSSHGADGRPEPVNPSPRFPAIEEKVLSFWKSDDTFHASVDNRKGCDEWVFYDGPPFANGLPHYGHLLTGYAKDVFPRFQT